MKSLGWGHKGNNSLDIVVRVIIIEKRATLKGNMILRKLEERYPAIARPKPRIPDRVRCKNGNSVMLPAIC
ncbi:MAG TPA: hypothetical protein ACFYEM_02585 [Candidatus Hypogeohydataceae bacterium YC40]